MAKNAIRKQFTKLAASYQEKVNPIVDRVISLLPAVGVGAYACMQSGVEKDGKIKYTPYDPQKNVYGYGDGAGFGPVATSVAIAFSLYALSQIGLAYANKGIDKLSDGYLKSGLKFTSGAIDAVNDMLVIVPTMNLLPSEVAAFAAINLLPTYLGRIEKDIKSLVAGNGLDGVYGPDIYGVTASGGIAKLFVENYVGSMLADSAEMKNFLMPITTKVISDFISGEGYKSGEFYLSLLETLAESYVWGSGTGINIPGLADIFQKFGGVVPEDAIKSAIKSAIKEATTKDATKDTTTELEEEFKTATTNLTPSEVNHLTAIKDAPHSVFKGMDFFMTTALIFYAMKEASVFMESDEPIDDVVGNARELGEGGSLVVPSVT